MPITTDRIVAVVAGLLVAAVTLAFIQPAIGAFGFVVAAIAIAMPGVALIVFREELAEQPSFARGIPHPAPEGFVGMMGWLFLLGVPALVLFAYRTSLGW